MLILLFCQATLVHYTNNDKGKRRVIGSASGRAKTLTPGESLFVADVVRRADRGNNGKSKLKIIDVIQELKPNLNQRQARDAYDRVVKKEHGQVLTGIIKAQPTTTARSAVTVEQQFRWHSLVDSMWTKLVKQGRLFFPTQVGKMWKKLDVHAI